MYFGGPGIENTEVVFSNSDRTGKNSLSQHSNYVLSQCPEISNLGFFPTSV
jgi:hypothetical protein